MGEVAFHQAAAASTDFNPPQFEDVDASFDAVREAYRMDERLRVPQQVFNSLKQRMESVGVA